MKKWFYTLAIFIAFAVSLSSCLKEPDNDGTGSETETTMDNLSVSEDFSWETSQNVTLVLSATSDNPELNSKISVYNGNPESEGELIINCGVNDETTFESEIQVPSYISTLYLKCEFPSGTTVTDSVSTSNTIEYTFTESATTKSAALISTEAPDSPECTGDVTITATSGGINVENGKTYLVTSNFSGDVNIQNGGGTLRICGNVTIKNINFNTAGAIEVTSSGILTFSNSLNLNSSSQELSNWGTLNLNSNFSPGGVFNNYGTANIPGLNINNEGTLLNTGQLNISGSFNNNNSSENSGTMEVSGHFNNNGGSTFINNCKLIVTGHFSQSSSLENSGYIYSGGTFSDNGGSSTEMISGAMIKAAKLHLNSNINGTGDYSSLSISNETKLNGGSSLTGNIDICDEDGIEHKGGTIAESVTYCQNYIPVSDCNPVGIGEPSIADSDDDGVADEQDEYPDDATRAYNSYYPNENDSATLVFEDLWPSTGDYDFNDLVTSVKGTYVTNASNKLVELLLTFNIQAVGAAQKNGLGIQFDNITSSAISSVSGTIENSSSGIALNGNGTEASQSKAVVIAIQNTEDVLNRAGGSMFNTVENGYVGTSDEVNITISFGNSPINISDINPSSFNFFLIKNQYREKEIHLPNRVPTDLVDVSEFGSSDDTSEPANDRYYKTSKNLPWGLLLLEPFKYPIEKTEIIEAYSNFADWAESNGTMYKDWYKNPDSSKVW